MINLSARETVRVSLTDAQIRGGAGQEYPNGEPGTVILEMSQQDERLVYVRFPRPFFGRNPEGGKSVKKTDHQHGMLVPEWNLVRRRPLI